MSEWKVSKERIELFPHPDAEKLELGKIGSYQVVVQKDLYTSGDLVVFAPEKSVLSGILEQEYKQYLVGVDKNRVKGLKFRGELSAGIIIPPVLCNNINLHQYEIGEDISAVMGITKYEPPIPANLVGEIKRIGVFGAGRHDCEQIGIYLNQLVPNERIVATEKLHGSQCINYKSPTEYFVTTKGFMRDELSLVESDTNDYWKAVRKTKVFELIEQHFPADSSIQIFSELLPCQKGYNYGFKEPVLRIFDIRLNGLSIPYDQVPEEFKQLWVPVIYDGPFIDIKHLKELCKGKETVSGLGLHIREGVVVAPYIDRCANDGTRLRLKVVNPDYKETGEEIN